MRLRLLWVYEQFWITIVMVWDYWTFTLVVYIYLIWDLVFRKRWPLTTFCHLSMLFAYIIFVKILECFMFKRVTIYLRSASFWQSYKFSLLYLIHLKVLLIRILSKRILQRYILSVINAVIMLNDCLYMNSDINVVEGIKNNNSKISSVRWGN